MRRAGLIGAVLIAVALAGCGSSQQQTTGARLADSATRTTTTSTQTAGAGGPALRAHPQAIQPVAGSAAPSSNDSAGAAGVSVGAPSGQLAQPVSEAVIRRELAQSGLSASTNRAALTANGLAVAPVNAPGAVQSVISAGNEIAHLPYRFGGGHGTFEDTAYDCSGSLSFVFAAAGLLNTTVTSGQLMNWGNPGPGKWITVFASPGHTFMYVAGLRFDTVALAETGSRWSNRSADEPDLSAFAIRHPPGL
jgi:cell wall-associated NlpC family hydrolase